MNTITLNKVQADLGSYITKALSNNELLTIATDAGAVVMISEKEWNAIQETIHLLKDEKSLTALIDGHKNRKKGNDLSAISAESAFYDL